MKRFYAALETKKEVVSVTEICCAGNQKRSSERDRNTVLE